MEEETIFIKPKSRPQITLIAQIYFRSGWVSAFVARNLRNRRNLRMIVLLNREVRLPEVQRGFCQRYDHPRAAVVVGECR